MRGGNLPEAYVYPQGMRETRDLLRHSEKAKKWMERKAKKHGKAKALAILSAKLGRTVWHLLAKKEVWDEARVFGK